MLQENEIIDALDSLNNRFLGDNRVKFSIINNAIVAEINHEGSFDHIYGIVNEVNRLKGFSWIRGKIQINNNSSIRTFYNVGFENKFFIVDSHLNDINFYSCTFKGGISASNAYLNCNCRFHECQFFESVDFDNASFEKLIDFWNSEFHCQCQFNKTDFMDRAIFSWVAFHKPVQFLHCRTKQNSVISFEESIFENGLDISRANFFCQLQFYGISFDKEEWGDYANYGLYQIYSKVDIPINSFWDRIRDCLPKNVVHSKERTIAFRYLRETQRIIKNSFNAQLNKIQAQIHYSNELRIYELELLSKPFYKWNEVLMLKMNRLSSGHGSRWDLALFFTAIVTTLTYLLIFIQVEGHIKLSYSDHLNYAMKVLNVTSWDFTLFGQSVQEFPGAYNILFIGRLFIGFGIYQFIQAFRKLGKP